MILLPRQHQTALIREQAANEQGLNIEEQACFQLPTNKSEPPSHQGAFE